MTLVIDPKVALLKGVDPVQFCVFSGNPIWDFRFYIPVRCRIYPVFCSMQQLERSGKYQTLSNRYVLFLH